MMRTNNVVGAGQTRGQVMLKGYCEQYTQVSVAERTGISPVSISYFVTGRQCPTRWQKLRLFCVAQIPVEAWSEAVK